MLIINSGMEQEKLKVLFISSWFPNKVNPTLGNFVEKHAEAVSLYADVAVLYVCFDDLLTSKQSYVYEKHHKLDVHIVYLRKIKTNLPFIASLVKLFRIIKAYYYGFHQIYKKEKPDIVHANVLIPIGLIAYCLKLIYHIPYIITEHWTGYLPQDANKPTWTLFFYRYFAKNAGALTPVTLSLAKAMQDFNIIGNYKVIPNVVETNLFKKKELTSDTIKHIIHISSLVDEQKNISGILLAIHELAKHRDDFVLEIISDGDFKQYQAIIERLGIADKIIYHGKKNTDEVAVILAHCDFLLLYSNYENFPCVIAEAMSCGLAVLSTDVGGIAEHINENNGILIEAHNSEMLISALMLMLSNCSNYNATKIRAYAENYFSYPIIGKQYIEVYQTVLNKTNNQGAR